MGTTPPNSSAAADALFTPVQQRVLGLLYGQPERRFQSAEIIRLADSGTGAVHRQLSRMAASGLVTTARVGNQKYYQANTGSPVFAELHGLIAKTVGLVEPIRQALAPYSDQIATAFIYGSIARGTEGSGSDVDLMIVSDTLDHATVYEALASAERLLARSVDPTLLTTEEWERRLATDDSLVARLSVQPRLAVLGESEDA
jgi:predicted nucleotidyltransferase